MPDQEMTCVDCKNLFVFTEGEQRFYEERQFTPPRRCKLCRDARKMQKAQDGQGQGSGYPVRAAVAPPSPPVFQEEYRGGGKKKRKSRGGEWDSE
jgi:hypothetical protein